MALDINNMIFIVHMVIWEQEKIPMYFKKQAPIKAQSGVQVGTLLFDKISTKIPAKYSNYNNIFLAKNVVKLPENIRMNKHAIKLEKDK